MITYKTLNNNAPIYIDLDPSLIIAPVSNDPLRQMSGEVLRYTMSSLILVTDGLEGRARRIASIRTLILFNIPSELNMPEVLAW